MTRTAVGQTGLSLLREHRWSVSALLVVIIVTTVPFLTKYPFTQDAGQLVLGVRYFSIEMHQPHPPGYPFFIAAGKLLSTFLPEHLALQVIACFFATAAVLLTYLFAWEIWRRRWLALFISLALLFNPVFWLYRETALTYTVDALGSVLVGLLAYHALASDLRWTRWGALALGLVAGFRPSLLVLMAPLLFFPVLSHRDWRKGLEAGAILAVSCSLWYVPLVYSSGGVMAFHHESSKLSSSAMSATSIFSGVKNATWNQSAFLAETLAATLNLFWIPLLLSGLLLTWRFFHQRRVPWHLVGFGAAWVLPSLLMYSLIHFGSPGYVLTLLPPACLMIAPATLMLSRGKLSRLLLGTAAGSLLLLQIGGFLLLSPNWTLTPSGDQALVKRLVYKAGRAFPYFFSFNTGTLRANDRRLAGLEKIVRTFPEVETIVLSGPNLKADPSRVVWGFGSAIETFRGLSTSLPEYRVLFLPRNAGFLLEARGNEMAYLPSYEMDRTVKRVVFTVDALPFVDDPPLPFQRRREYGQTYFVADIEGPFTIFGRRFLVSK